MTDADAARELVDASRRADRVHASFRALECAAAACFGGAVVLAAGVASGAGIGAALLAVSTASAAITAALAWREHAPRAGTAARRADRAAGLDGALITVVDRAGLDRDRPAEASSVAALLASRIAPAVRPADLARAALPRTPIAIAAPLLGAAIVGFALERRAPDPLAGSDAAAGGRAAASKDAGRSSSPTAREAAARATALDAAGDLARAAAEARAAGRDSTADALESAERRAESLARPDRDPAAAAALAAELAQIARTLPPDDGGARAAVERAASELARIAASDSPGNAGGSAPSAGGRTSLDGAALANASGDGRMLGPPAGGESDPRSGVPSSGTDATGGAGSGVLSARWWPSRYDDVVARYLTP